MSALLPILRRRRLSGGAAFTPASLFASGEEGAWYEPSTTTCFTDTAGTTAATHGDAVARINDLSGNGNHATQATAAARPILARVPEGGRRNELSETDTLATQSVTVTAAERTLSFTGTGTVTLTGASTAGPLVGTGAGDRVSLTFTPSAGSLTLTVLGTVTDAQLELGASVTTYQSVADSLGYDITEAGVTSLEYLAFDGSDDFMLHTFGTASDVSMFAGAERTSGSNIQGLFGVTAPSTILSGNIVANSVNPNWGTYGGGFQSSGETILNAPSVLTNLCDVSLPSQKLYTNGNFSVDVTGALYGGDLLDRRIIGNDADYRFFAGKLFCVVAVDRLVTTAERQNTEGYVANLTGVTL